MKCGFANIETNPRETLQSMEAPNGIQGFPEILIRDGESLMVGVLHSKNCWFIWFIQPAHCQHHVLQ
jgi:hypothetical protein